jgi:hypothetical protein
LKHKIDRKFVGAGLALCFQFYLKAIKSKPAHPNLVFLPEVSSVTQIFRAGFVVNFMAANKDLSAKPAPTTQKFFCKD